MPDRIANFRRAAHAVLHTLRQFEIVPSFRRELLSESDALSCNAAAVWNVLHELEALATCARALGFPPPIELEKSPPKYLPMPITWSETRTTCWITWPSGVREGKGGDSIRAGADTDVERTEYSADELKDFFERGQARGIQILVEKRTRTKAILALRKWMSHVDGLGERADEENGDALADDPNGPVEGRPAVSRREPGKDAMTVYRYATATGKKQIELANDTYLMKILGKALTQGTISRHLKQVKEWLEAGNILPNLDDDLQSKPASIDPSIIELGQRRDGRTPRQRPKADGDDCE